MEKETLNLIHEEVGRKLDLQIDLISRLDTKAGTTIGFLGIIIGIVTSLRWELLLNEALTLTGLFVLFLAVSLAFLSFRSRAYRRDPEPRPLVENYLMADPEVVRKQLIDNYVDSFEHNQRLIARKARYVNWSLGVTMVGLAIPILSRIVSW